MSRPSAQAQGHSRGSIMSFRSFSGVRGLACAAAALVCLGGQAHAADTLVDNYAGGMNFYPGGGDVIGEASTFNISDLIASRPNPDELVIQIDTNFAGAPGTAAALGTGYGALFFTPGAHAWNPTGVAPYPTDTYTPGEWSYAFTIPAVPGSASGTGALYATGSGQVVLSNTYGDPTSYPNPGNNGYYFRQGQAVQFTPDASASALALGTWSVAPGSLTFTIDDNGLLGDDFAISWAETCANDVIQGQISGAPEPATWALLLLAVGLVGQALRRRSRLGFA